MKKEDNGIEHLLELNGIRYVIEEYLGLWVKFEVRLTEPNEERPHGIKYSLSLHDRFNKRILGFDNAHAIGCTGKVKVTAKSVYDHWHRDEFDNGRAYDYQNAGKLLEDFWKEVDKVIKKLGS